MQEIVIHGGDYPHVAGIAGGYEGVRIAYRTRAVRQVFVDMLEQRSYECCEFSAANYLLLRASGQDWLTALPIFPYRAFRHSLLLVRRESELTDPARLAGCRIGVDDYSMTAAVWVRGLLRSEYGLDHRDVTWVTPHRQRFPIPAGARVEQVDVAAMSLEERLVAGDIDAWLGFDPQDFKRTAHERRLRTLLPDPAVAEQAYFRRTGLFPIHHCVVVRNDVLERVPQLPAALMQAYSGAKARALAQRPEALLPWHSMDPVQQMALFGGDPLPYGLTEGNRRNVETLAGYLQAQGFAASMPGIDRLFA